MDEIIKNNIIFCLFTFEYVIAFNISKVPVFLAGCISAFALKFVDYA